MFYAVTIGVCMVLIALFNIVFSGSLYSLSPLYIIIAVVVSTVAVIAVDGLFAFIIRRLPERWFNSDRKFFCVKKRELKFYDFLQIKKWKDKVLELGMFTSFRKNKLADPKSNEYLTRFLLESAYGIIIHIACIIVGFSIIFIYPLKYAFMFGVPVAIVNAFLNYLPLCILRYNTPRLKMLKKLNRTPNPPQNSD